MLVRLTTLVTTTVHLMRRRLSAGDGQAGMSTAEYAVGLVAACAFAALLYKILTSAEMESLLRGLISRALHTAV
jgi:hypothetical protein